MAEAVGHEGQGQRLFHGLEDHPHRDYRALMIDIKNHWHSPEEIRRHIRLCRFYKVKYLSLHTGEGQWIGAVTRQLDKLSAEERAKHKLYTRQEMDDLIAYARAHGVRMLPHNEATPHFGHMKDSMKQDYVSGDEFKGFPDELDGKGSYADYEGKPDDRWMTVMEKAIHLAIDQFAAGYPDGTLPYYHIGPVLGEGGMSPELAVKVLEMIHRKSPETRMMYWNGPNARDASLSPHKDKIVIAYYDDEFGASDMNAYLKEGWTVVNSAWSPLYVVGSRLARPVEKVYTDWNLLRQGSDGVPGGYGAIKWEQVSDAKLAEGLIGGMLCTWEVPTKVHFDRLRLRVPAFAENAWGGKPWPYDEGSFKGLAERLAETDRRLSVYLEEESAAPAMPVEAKASQGTAKNRVRLEWRGGGGVRAEGFRVFRADSSELAEARQVSPDLKAWDEGFEDTEVEDEKRYFYWVKAFNDAGESPAAGPLEGSAGTGVARISSRESFNYDPSLAPDGANGGRGWKNAWKVQKGGEVIRLDPEGLNYGELTCSGGSLRLSPTTDEGGGAIVRDIDGMMGLDETTMWISYLVQADKVAVGDLYISPNGRTEAASGKAWGRNFALYTSNSSIGMQKGKTHFVVARYDFNASDQVWLWVDPPLDREPSKEDADQVLTGEIGHGSQIRIQFQGHGQGDYRIDELRLGTSWLGVGGLTGGDDQEPPNPNPVTWIGPPSQEEDGSVYMIAAPADDDSGVEYYFECTEGNAPDSGWQDSSEYRLTGLEPGNYAFRVRCRDRSKNRNTSEWSFAGKVKVVSAK
ncbi:MAG: family 20 glycosylhydrolase [Verrucomicrobiota bacterium]